MSGISAKTVIKISLYPYKIYSQNITFFSSANIKGTKKNNPVVTKLNKQTNIRSLHVILNFSS